jgi:hypothetical protein
VIHDDFTTLAVIVGVAAAAGIVANRLRLAPEGARL